MGGKKLQSGKLQSGIPRWKTKVWSVRMLKIKDLMYKLLSHKYLAKLNISPFVEQNMRYSCRAATEDIHFFPIVHVHTKDLLQFFEKVKL